MNDNNKYLLSVIVPVYNTEKYISECLDHLVKMGDRAQIILADDESTDNSYSICREYAAKYKNIVLLSEKNGGPSCARNLALGSATGKYTVFCDSDDWLDERIINELEKYENDNIDFFQFGINGDCELLYNDVTFLDDEQKEDLYSLIIGLRDQRNIGHGYFGLVTCKLFRSELLEGLKFDPEVVGEDTLYAVQAFARVKTAVFLPYRYYHYRYVEGSYSKRYFPNIIPMATRMLERMKSEIPNSPLMKRAFDYHAIDKFYWCMQASIQDRQNNKEVYARMRELYNIPVFRSALKNRNLKQRGLKAGIKFMLFDTGLLRLYSLWYAARSAK